MNLSTVKPGILGENGRASAFQTQSQLNMQAGVRNSSTVIPNRWNNGDVSMSVGSAFLNIRVGADDNTYNTFQFPKAAQSYDYGYLSFQSGSGAPTTAAYPDDGNYGFYQDTVSSWVYLGINHSGSVVVQNIQTLAGSITAAQHGDLSSTANTSVMHSFAQVSGTITAAQHGNFTAATANDFLHALATTAFNGFLSSSGFGLLTRATAAASLDALVRRDATSGGATFGGTVIGTLFDANGSYRVSGTRVVDNRQTGWGTPTGTVSRAAFATYTSPTIASTYNQTQIQDIADGLEDVSRHLAALIVDMLPASGHGLIGA